MKTKDTRIGMYNDGLKHGLPLDKFKISPSSFYLFHETPHKWLETQFFGDDVFKPNNGSCAGSLVHAHAEAYYSQEPITDAEIAEYLGTLHYRTDTFMGNTFVALDPAVVAEKWKGMYNVLEMQYLDKVDIHSVEPYIFTETSDTTVLAGSVDMLRHDPMTGGLVVVDYKTCAKQPKSAELKHKYQVQLYAHILTELGHNITGYEIVYVSDKQVLKTKTNPQTVKVYTFPFEPEFIASQIKLVADTMDFFFNNPEHAYIIFKDYRLKGRTFDVAKYLPSESTGDDQF